MSIATSFFSVIIPPLHSGHLEIHSQINVYASDGGQNPLSSFCVKIHFKVEFVWNLEVH